MYRSAMKIILRQKAKNPEALVLNRVIEHHEHIESSDDFIRNMGQGAQHGIYCV